MKMWMIALALTLMGSPATWAAKETPVPQYPVREFFKNPEITGFQLSEDGRWLAYLKPWENRMNIFVRPSAGGSEVRLTSMKDRDVAYFFWKGSQHLLYSRDFGGDENYHVFVVDVQTRQEKDLTPYPGVRASVVDELDDVSKDEILISHNKRDAKVFDVYRVSLKTGKETRIAQNNGKIMGWLTDHRGQLRVAIESDGVNTNLLYRESEKQPFKNILTTSFKDQMRPVFFTFDNKRLYAISNLGRDKAAVVEFDPKTAKEVRILAQHTDNDIMGLSYSKKRKVLTSARVNTWKIFPLFFDPEIEGLYNKLSKRLPDVEISLSSTNKAEDLYVVRTYSDRSRGAFYLYDVKGDSLLELAKLDILPPEHMVELKPIQYQSRDGLTIHGYLSLPKGVKAEKLPVIVNPHGGPWARDYWGFNPEVQFLANRGYAVLQMNFRGSTSYGKKFWEASFGQWGLKMQDDVTDGVQWLISEGIADPKRICIYGGSYGGYTTLAGLAFTPDLYACGVDYVGVSNLFTFLKTIPPYWKPMLDQMYEMVGHPEKDKDRLTRTSPALNTEKIKAPLFIAQGAKDPRVNKDESDQVVAALKKRGIDVPYLVKEEEGHGFRNEENRFEFYEAMEKFLQKHLTR